MRRLAGLLSRAGQRVCADRLLARRRVWRRRVLRRVRLRHVCRFGYRRAPRLFAFVVAGMFAATLWFLGVQAFILHAFCRYCLLSAAATFLLAGIAVSLPESFGGAGSPKVFSRCSAHRFRYFQNRRFSRGK